MFYLVFICFPIFLVTDAEVSYAKGDLAAAETQLSQIDLILEELNAAAGVMVPEVTSWLATSGRERFIMV